MNSFNFQIVTVANLAAITTPFPDHICYFTEDTENYYIWENDALKEIFVDASSITWNNITNKPTTISGYGITDAVTGLGKNQRMAIWTGPTTLTYSDQIEAYEGLGEGVISVKGPTSFINIFSGNIRNVGYLGSAGNIDLCSFGTKYSQLSFQRARGTLGAQTQAQLNDKIGRINYFAGDGSGLGYIDCIASENHTTSNMGIKFEFAIIKNGTSQNPFKSLVLDSDGAVKISDVYKLPITIGSANQVIKSDGLGSSSWGTVNITEVTNGLSSTLLGAPNGIATLDSNSKLVMSQMPISVMDYKGTYDILTNTPNLVDGTGNQGDVYVCTTAGTRTFGVGNTLTVSVGDWLIYNGTKWEKTLGNNVGSGTVSSVGLSLGTTGTDVNISNSPITSSGSINLNIPTASATARGVLSIADWNTFNDKIGGLGQNNFVPRFDSSNTLTSGIIEDNGTWVGVGFQGHSNTKVAIRSALTFGLSVQTTVSNSIACSFYSNGAGAGNNLGIQVQVNSAVNSNTGISTTVSGGSGENIGIISQVTGGTTRYALSLIDGTELNGRFLKCVNGGKANWANITAADVSGAVGAVGGINNYVAKFTPDGTTIGNSLIQDNGTTIGVNMAPNANAKFFVTGGSQSNAIAAQSNVNNGTAISGQAFTGTGTLVGVSGFANSATSTNNIGLFGKAINAASNYSIQLIDGTETVAGRFLRNMTTDGKANWAHLPDTAQIMCSDLVTPITASTTILKGFWIAPTNGKLTDIFANLLTSQAGGSTFTVEVKMSSTIIATLTISNLSTASNTIAPTNTFTKGTVFQIFVTQVGDGTAKGLLTTINYERT